MQLTQFTDLGLRVLMYLNQPGRTRLVTNHEIASQFNVPLNHLVKVVHQLGKLGWITTLRGRNGGLLLRADPQQLSIACIVRHMESDKPLIDCKASACTLTGHCRLSHALQEAVQVFYAHLENISLADVCTHETGLAIVRMHQLFLNTPEHVSSPPV
jgi:Rrf2 family nitric oxide-sensitive transcriptional repressor